LGVERGVPEPWGSQYDVRALLNSMAVLRDGQKLQLDGQKVQLDGQGLQLPDHLVELLQQTDLGELLRQYGLIGELDEEHITIAVRKVPPRAMTVL
jgi:oleate hydratase